MSNSDNNILPMSVEQALKQGIELLKSAATDDSLTDAKTDVEYLLSFVLQQDFTWLKTWPEHCLLQEQQEKFEELLQRRQKGEPIAYLVGNKAFWNLILKTTPATLIPRAETESLVELALDFLKHKSRAKVLDLGTGTGAIALAIASERPDDEIFACDFQADAVALAQENAQSNNLQHVKIFQSDWFSSVLERDFDLIVANPPYVAPDDPHLQRDDLIFEPDSALVADDDGFSDINHIIANAQEYLRRGGGLMLEHGYRQAEAIRNTMIEKGYLTVSTHGDIAGLDRITMGIKSKE
ncbi:MAG: peptide chain release factor N(5)-glutamine methyltransferase [Gammaproteobacteria bacterium]|nr:peptide chain release factor N(5)-glutamine methyltransferase [Gammaproteobacteria bacterium]